MSDNGDTLNNLLSKLNDLCSQSMQNATAFCCREGNPYVDVAHWLYQMLFFQDSDLLRILRHYDVSSERLAKELSLFLETLPRDAGAGLVGYSSHLQDALGLAWNDCTLRHKQSRIRSAHIIIALLKSVELNSVVQAISSEFGKISADDLSAHFHSLCADSPENQDCAFFRGDAEAASPGADNPLSRFATNLTAQAKEGALDQVIGRDDEIRQVIDILMRRRQNNPILTGEAGVGKTAAVEGLALKIAAGDVPPALQEVELYTLDIGLLQAGASMKGEFEARLKSVIDTVHASSTPIILFIDEAHTLMGAGGAAGTGDAANLLKPALARGTLRTIAATTWAEYKKHIEKDPALTRRFQVVKIEEPSVERAIEMMRAIAPAMADHHGVLILDEAISAAVHLSHRYIPARQLPDKCVSLIDTASARVATSLHATPSEVERGRKKIEALERERAVLEKERALGRDRDERLDRLQALHADEIAALEALESRWKQECALVEALLEQNHKVLNAHDVHGASAQAQRRLAELKAELADLQAGQPLIYPEVDEQAVAAVVESWTGIPVGRMVKDEVEAVLNLADVMGARVIGQSHALASIAKRIQTSRAGLDNPNKPVGVFMLAGPSGVGKTETALALAESLYGGEQNVITINMSEFQEAHTVSTLKGAPPGYVGYGEGGVLTEAVRRTPHSVVLLDEIEKAHSDVHELFFQVFDKGVMEDGEGRLIDFKNTIILLTSNVGSDEIIQICEGGRLRPEPDQIESSLRDLMMQHFPAALLGRLVVIPYYPLADEVLANIVRLQLNRIKQRVEHQHEIPFVYSDEVVDLIVHRCTSVESGGRLIDAILTNTVLPEVSRSYLQSLTEGRRLARVELTVEEGDFSYQFE